MKRKVVNKSIGLILVLAILISVLCPSSAFMAMDDDGTSVGSVTGGTVTFEFNSGTLTPSSTNCMVQPQKYIVDGKEYVSFFYYGAPQGILTSSNMVEYGSEVYAYKIELTPTAYTVNGSGNLEWRFMAGPSNCFADLSGTFSSAVGVSSGTVSSFYVLNEYKAQSIYLAPVFMFGYSDSGSSCGVNFQATYNYTIFMYNMEDYSDVLLAEILAEMESHGDKLTSYMGKDTADLLQYIYNKMGNWEYSYLNLYRDSLEALLEDMDALIEEEQKQTTWLEKIWNAIMDLINPKEEDKNMTDEANSESDEKSSQMDSLVSDMKTEKPNIESVSGSVDAYIPSEGIAAYSAILAVMFENDLIVTMVLIVLSVALVSYVLFGKKE